MLEVANLEVVYNDTLLVLRGISLSVPAGKIVALLGTNGAGKTTTLRAIGGLLDVHDGEITKGAVRFEDRKLNELDPADIVSGGITQVLEGRRIFAEMTVQENLMTGAHTVREKARIDAAFDRVMGLFPALRDRLGHTAGYLSGGEQQMVAIGRALMASPKLLILDEPSLGLAPRLVQTIRDIIVEVNKQGTAVLLIEQNARMALSIAQHGYVMETGRIVLDGPAEKLLKDEDVKEFYLGLGAAGTRKSFKDVKHYKRRKRWLS